MPKVIQVIESDVCMGEGTGEDTYRNVMTYHTLEGEFLAKNDPCAPNEWEAARSKRRVEELKKRVEKLVEVGKRAATTLKAIMQSERIWYNNDEEKHVAKETLQACEKIGLLKIEDER